MSGSSLGVLRVVSRWNRATNQETKRKRILKIATFLGKGGCALALSDTLCNNYNITEYGRSCLPCTALPYSHTAARPRWVTPFYVLRYFLRVGTLRAQDSKCHSRHFFTPKLRSRNAGHFPVRSQNFQKNGLHLLQYNSITHLWVNSRWVIELYCR